MRSISCSVAGENEVGGVEMSLVPVVDVISVFLFEHNESRIIEIFVVKKSTNSSASCVCVECCGSTQPLPLPVSVETPNIDLVYRRVLWQHATTAAPRQLGDSEHRFSISPTLFNLHCVVLNRGVKQQSVDNNAFLSG